jgi:hypothetical protein
LSGRTGTGAHFFGRTWTEASSSSARLPILLLPRRITSPGCLTFLLSRSPPSLNPVASFSPPVLPPPRPSSLGFCRKKGASGTQRQSPVPPGGKKRPQGSKRSRNKKAGGELGYSGGSRELLAPALGKCGAVSPSSYTLPPHPPTPNSSGQAGRPRASRREGEGA